MISRNLFATLLLLFASATLHAQVDLVFDNDVVGHDIKVGQCMPPALRQLVGTRQLDIVKRNQSPALSHYRKRVSLKTSTTNNSDIGPLLKSIRGQDEPYNLLCPTYTYADGRVSSSPCASGCVAESIEQILAYYKYPEALQDTLFGWSTDNYTITDLPKGTRFDWDNYLSDYRNGWTEAQGQAIALTTLAVGMAVKMHYTPGSSGASTYNAVEPLKKAFGYGMVKWVDRVLYSPDQWHAMLQHELINGRPIAYVGHNMEMSGHAFNIDGIDSRGYYHINWGYDGYYDGWYDLDWLNPWETTDLLPNGIAYGFFSNQGALFLHPSKEARPLSADSLDINDLGIDIIRHEFLRTPENQGYTAIDLTFVNNSTNDVTYTYELFTYLPTDTAIFEQADYIGISAITIPAGSTKTQRTYTMFHEAGDRIFGISHDDSTICYSIPITVEKGKTAKINWSNLQYELNPEENGSHFTATFTVDVNNLSTDAYGSAIIFYCLYPEGQEAEDFRHFDVLDLPANEHSTLKVNFSKLKPATHYHFLLRSPWAVQASVEFDTPQATAVKSLTSGMYTDDAFDLYGMPWRKSSKGIMIKNGKKWLNR